MIFRHYRELVTEKAAKAWFAITTEAGKARREAWEAEFRVAAKQGKREAREKGERVDKIVALPGKAAA